MVREMEKSMGNNEIQGYEPFVDELKQLIHKKQYHVLKVINAETINLYWEIGEEIYRQQKKAGENQLFRFCLRNYRKNSREQRGILLQICGECVISI